ncbi:MAG: metallophosphoesterase [Alcanivorax jadensis]|uniref:metallophosphoesterase n=1 Tax=Alcanivorax jadensis TaxID=64988 RepID=UPI0030023259
MLLLHISDIHFKSPNCLNPSTDPERPYRTALVQDVEKRVQALGQVGAILIGGDIAFKAAEDEYKAATQWISELAAVAGCPMERVYVVPGNHDVDRTVAANSMATRNAQKAILNSGNKERELRGQMHDPDTARALFAPIEAYNNFASPFGCQVYLPDQPYWSQDLELGEGVTLRIHGLTSVFLSGVDGKDDEQRGLYLSPLQTVLDPVRDVVNLVLSHHPPDWFMDCDDAEDRICGRAHIHMFGHKHRQRYQNDERYVRFHAGAVNPDRDEQGWQPGYNLVELKIASQGAFRQIEVKSHLLEWQTNPDRFRPRLNDDDEHIFSHVIRFPGSAEPLQAVPSVSLDDSMTAPQEPSLSSGSAAKVGDDSGVGSMGTARTRNLVFRFWQLRSSDRREIARSLGLITEEDMKFLETERYGRALRRAAQEGKLDALACEVEKWEARK